MALQGQPGQGNSGTGTIVSGGGAGKDSKKAEAIARFKANRAAKQKAAFENALKLRDELVKGQFLDRLTKEAKEFVLSLCKDPAEKAKGGGFGGPSVFSILFGDNPTVGQKVTLEEAFNKTYKGQSTLNLWVKRWADKGIEVKINPAPKMLDTTYEIVKLPA